MFADPVKNLKTLGLKENDIVADLGAGTGFYSVAAGVLVPQGKVYAVEVVKDFLTTVKNKAQEAGLHNVECLWGDIEKVGGTKIRDRIIDVVIASNVFFQVEHKDKFIDEASRILKDGGKILLIDWSDYFSIGHKAFVPKEKAKEMFEKKGFVLEKEIDAGAHHYGMIFTKSLMS